MLVGISTFIDDYFASTTTSTGSSTGTTIVDTALEKWGDGRLIGRFVRITTSGTTQFQVGRIINSVQATGTITVAPPFTAQILTATAYDLHQYEPRKKFAALDSARIPVANDVFRLIIDETITTDGYSNEYAVPSSIRRGPALVYIESIPMSPETIWNFIPAPQSDNGMTLWTASSLTKSTYTRVPEDRVIPKFGPACTKCAVAASTTGTLTLTVANMINGITAAKSAGRPLTYAAWIYCKTANDITINITDDTGIIGTSEPHQGQGWELIHVTLTTSQTNATTLSIQITEDSANAVTFYVNNQFFYYGYYSQISSTFFSTIPAQVRRDDNNKTFILPSSPVERRQLRVIGKEILSDLGTNVVTQNTNTMEVDNTTAEIVYAKASEILFEQERISTQNLQQVMQRIAHVKDRIPELRMNWDLDIVPQRFTSPYQR